MELNNEGLYILQAKTLVGELIIGLTAEQVQGALSIGINEYLDCSRVVTVPGENAYTNWTETPRPEFGAIAMNEDVMVREAFVRVLASTTSMSGKIGESYSGGAMPNISVYKSTMRHFAKEVAGAKIHFFHDHELHKVLENVNDPEHQTVNNSSELRDFIYLNQDRIRRCANKEMRGVERSLMLIDSLTGVIASLLAAQSDVLTRKKTVELGVLCEGMEVEKAYEMIRASIASKFQRTIAEWGNGGVGINAMGAEKSYSLVKYPRYVSAWDDTQTLLVQDVLMRPGQISVVAEVGINQRHGMSKNFSELLARDNTICVVPEWLNLDNRFNEKNFIPTLEGFRLATVGMEVAVKEFGAQVKHGVTDNWTIYQRSLTKGWSPYWGIRMEEQIELIACECMKATWLYMQGAENEGRFNMLEKGPDSIVWAAFADLINKVIETGTTRVQHFCELVSDTFHPLMGLGNETIEGTPLILICRMSRWSDLTPSAQAYLYVLLNHIQGGILDKIGTRIFSSRHLTDVGAAVYWRGM